MAKIRLYFSEESPYLNAKLKVSEIAEIRNLSPTYISQAIKFHDIHNFNYFVNEYRANMAKKLRRDDKEKKSKYYSFHFRKDRLRNDPKIFKGFLKH